MKLSLVVYTVLLPESLDCDFDAESWRSMLLIDVACRLNVFGFPISVKSCVKAKVYPVGFIQYAS